MDGGFKWYSLRQVSRRFLPDLDWGLQEYVLLSLVSHFPNFFLVCQLGCTACSDGTGVCIACADGFTQNANDKTKCTAESTKSSSGAVCPNGSFGDGSAQCKSCDPACATCNGATSNDCLTCASGTYVFNGTCVSASSTGVCDGGSLIADNNKGACDSKFILICVITGFQ